MCYCRHSFFPLFLLFFMLINSSYSPKHVSVAFTMALCSVQWLPNNIGLNIVYSEEKDWARHMLDACFVYNCLVVIAYCILIYYPPIHIY